MFEIELKAHFENKASSNINEEVVASTNSIQQKGKHILTSNSGGNWKRHAQDKENHYNLK